MNSRKCSLLALQWALGLLLAGQAALLLLHASVPYRIAEQWFGAWAMCLIAGTEVIAGALFLIRPTLRSGGWLLIGVLVAATALHALVGMALPVEFVIYVAAIAVVMSHRKQARFEPSGTEPRR